MNQTIPTTQPELHQVTASFLASRGVSANSSLADSGRAAHQSCSQLLLQTEWAGTVTTHFAVPRDFG